MRMSFEQAQKLPTRVPPLLKAFKARVDKAEEHYTQAAAPLAELSARIKELEQKRSAVLNPAEQAFKNETDAAEAELVEALRKAGITGAM